MSTAKRSGVPLKGGPEHDALTRFKRFLRWRPGQRKAAKASFNRRLRRRPVDLGDAARDDET
jgi:hypothetical protein